MKVTVINEAVSIDKLASDISNYPQISGVLNATANLSLTKQVPVHSGNSSYTNIYPRTKVTFVKAGS